MDLFNQLPGNGPKKDGLDSIRNLMGAFAFLGAPADLMTILMDFGGLDLSTEHRRFLTGPVVQHKSEFASLTPSWMFGMVAGERLEIILQEQKEGITGGWRVGPVELTAALYPATHEAPMQHDYGEIYLWAASYACVKHYNKPREHFLKAVGAHVVQDAEITEPRGRYFYTYRDLCQTIRKRVVSVQAGRERATKPKQTAPGKQPPKSTRGGVEQLSLF